MRTLIHPVVLFSVLTAAGVSAAFAGAGYQHIASPDVILTAVLKLSPALTTALSCFSAIGLMFYHRGKVRSRRE